jgi:hemerythrin superfamily protein
MNDNVEDLKVKLRDKKDRCQRILNSLKNNNEFKELMSDLKEQSARIDSCWHLIPEGKEWESKVKEIRITKLATEYVLNILNVYENDMIVADKQLIELENKSIIQAKDFDNE